MIGKVNVWNALINSFELGTPLNGDIEIRSTSDTLNDYLIDAMKNRKDITITIGGVKDD